MVIIDEKAPPPPYFAQVLPVVPDHRNRTAPKLSSLPASLLLQIVYYTFPSGPHPAIQTFDDDRQDRINMTLDWIEMSLRKVNRGFYTACMHVLRSTYLPSYSELVRSPYTSDPFPLSSEDSSYAPSDCSSASPSPTPASPSTPLTALPTSADASMSSLPSYRVLSTNPTAPSPVLSAHRETQVLDLYIALRVKEDLLSSGTSLHLPAEESFRDLFELMQPRARMEDLVFARGAKYGYITLQDGANGVYKPSSRSGSGGRLRPIPSSAISVSFSPRKAALLVIMMGNRRVTIAEVARERNEKLEYAARKLGKGLQAWINSGGR